MAASRDRSRWLGPALFTATFIAVLVFFWWLLIFDHGGPSVH